MKTICDHANDEMCGLYADCFIFCSPETGTNYLTLSMDMSDHITTVSSAAFHLSYCIKELKAIPTFTLPANTLQKSNDPCNAKVNSDLNQSLLQNLKRVSELRGDSLCTITLPYIKNFSRKSGCQPDI
ncbi:MAG TPA: hypothetical protein VM935_16180, partial [Chitinophagaceae bacterium]|nr:hypothetical protein [Chitinophagaceae bacterium]